MSGWIKLHRSTIGWEWYSDHNTCRLFIHCLLRANYEDAKWRGQTIKRGQFITSIETLQKETGLSTSQIRTSIKKLISTNEIASLSQARSRVITIVEYDSYQANDNQDDKLMAGSSQADDKLMTTDKKLKNLKNEKKKDKDPVEPVDFSVFGLPENQIAEIKRIRKKNKGGAITQRVANALAKELQAGQSMGYSVDDLLTEWEVRSWKSFKAGWMDAKAGQYSAVTQHNINVLSNLELD